VRRARRAVKRRRQPTFCLRAAVSQKIRVFLPHLAFAHTQTRGVVDWEFPPVTDSAGRRTADKPEDLSFFVTDWPLREAVYQAWYQARYIAYQW
jgi:hypothetical protein